MTFDLRYPSLCGPDDNLAIHHLGDDFLSVSHTTAIYIPPIRFSGDGNIISISMIELGLAIGLGLGMVSRSTSNLNSHP